MGGGELDDPALLIPEEGVGQHDEGPVTPSENRRERVVEVTGAVHLHRVNLHAAAPGRGFRLAQLVRGLGHLGARPGAAAGQHEHQRRQGGAEQHADAPEYPCAHCVQSATAAAVLETLLGTAEIPEVSMTSSTAPGGSPMFASKSPS